MLTRQNVGEIKARALRSRVWFKATSRLERGIIDLTLRCVARVRSPVLTSIISGIANKISEILENGFLKLAQNIGARIANQICEIATTWGNRGAIDWKDDDSFTRFLGVTAINMRSRWP